MRFCFYNPHSVHSGLGITVFSRIFRRKKTILKADERYAYLLTMLKRRGKQTAVVVDDTATSLTNGSEKAFFLYKIRWLMKIIVFMEIYLWCFINGLNPFHQTIIFGSKKLDPKSDVLFSFAFLSDTFMYPWLTDRSVFADFKGKKILHATHYHRRTHRIAQNIKRTGTKYFIGEADLKKNPYFRKYFPFVKKVHILPYALRKRYKRTVAFDTRINKCAAFGTYAVFSNIANDMKDFYDFYKINALHPMRKTLFHNQKTLIKYIDCYIDDGKEEIDKYHSSFFYKIPLLRSIGNMFYQGGAKYFSFDIVETFNQYEMFIAPEEQTGLPSINFIEGISCGCAYVGLNHPIYKDIGMIPGKHYIGYNGTLNDLIRKIAYYQKNPAKLQSIAENGYKFVILNCTVSGVQKRFFSIINNLN